VFFAIELGELLLELTDFVRHDVVATRRRLRSPLGVGVEDHRGSLEMPPHLGPDQFVKFISAKVALRAPADCSARPERIVPRAVVVVMEGAVATPHAVTGRPQIAYAAADQASEQVVAGLQVARTEATVDDMQGLRASEQLFAEDRWHAQRDPLGNRPAAAAALGASASPRGLGVPVERFVAIEIHRADVSLIAEQASDGARSPACSPRRRGMRGLC